MRQIMFRTIINCLVLLGVVGLLAGPAAAQDGKLNVLATSADYAFVAEYLAGDKAVVNHIIEPDQDPHTVKPKPSIAQKIAAADLLLATGLDLEMWLPLLIDKAGSDKVREGQDGYVAVQYGMALLEKPTSLDRSQGDVHVYGNPHFHTSPLNAKVIARNIAIGLIKNDPANEAYYKRRLKDFHTEIDRRMFGSKLVKLLGAKTLGKLARSGNLIPFLKKKKVKGKQLIDSLGGWMKKAMPLRGKKVVSYHKNWAYFAELFGIEMVGEIEPKPGIPPSARDVANIINTMTRENIKVIFAANYFDENKVKLICEKVGARPIIVPLSTRGEEAAKDYFALIDLWLDRLLAAE